MAIVAPIAPTPITALPTPPTTSDPTNFDSRADSFLGALPTNQTQLNATATNVYNNSVKTYNSATDTTTAATNAVNAATAASNSATTATTAATSATTSLNNMQKLYLGIKSSPPTVDNQGNPLQAGAWYTNSSTQYWYWWNGTNWILGVGDLTTVDFITQVTNKPTTTQGYGITNVVNSVNSLTGDVNGVQILTQRNSVSADNGNPLVANSEYLLTATTSYSRALPAGIAGDKIVLNNDSGWGSSLFVLTRNASGNTINKVADDVTFDTNTANRVILTCSQPGQWVLSVS